MNLRHPFDQKDRERDRQRLMDQDRCGNCRRRTDRVAFDRKSLVKLSRKGLEQLDMFRFFAGELQECADAIIVLIERWANMIEHERQNEFLDQTEDLQIRMSFDLVK